MRKIKLRYKTYLKKFNYLSLNIAPMNFIHFIKVITNFFSSLYYYQVSYSVFWEFHWLYGILDCLTLFIYLSRNNFKTYTCVRHVYICRHKHE